MRNMTRCLRTTCLLLFLGWLLVWIMVPTKLYKFEWGPKLAGKLNTTFFGQQGTELVLLTIPVMFIAALGCLYLHLQQKTVKNHSSKSICDDKKRSHLGVLRRPMLVMEPLGIVTALELTFALMFIALLIWSLANYIYVSFRYPHMHREGEEAWQVKFRSVSLRVGYVGHICWAFLFFPVTRGSSILSLVGLTSEASIKYHIWLGHLSNLLFLLHTVGFFIYWGITHQMSEALEWSATYDSNVAGEIAMVIGILMWVPSIRSIRRKMFEVFFYSHHLYLVYIVFYVLHVGDASFCMILPNMFLFFLDRYLRFLQSRQRCRLLSARTLPSGSIELNFLKSSELRYNPTSTLFINVPAISKLQWHPFTVISNCNTEQNTLSVIVTNQGSWTQKLYRAISSSDRIEFSTEGPYGPNSFDFLRHDSLILVSGGSGIAPFISVIREIIFLQGEDETRQLPRVLLVCAFQHYEDLAMLDLLFPASGVRSPSQISRLQLRIEAYITKEKEQPKPQTKSNLLQTKWFKGHPSDLPITPVLGPNNWLWLGIAIVSSFSMLLLLIGMVYQYYIYPLDHNTGKIYHFSYRILWLMFLSCACICITSSAVFLWHKKRNSVTKEKPVESMDGPTPASSPSSWLCSDDRELESLPYHSVVQATNIHFGSRPNLKEILLNSEGSKDVGVMVCGPRKMRHEVARICSSGLAQNLHFEAISFNW